MSSQKPWRTIILGASTGRFDREQIRRAILDVKAESVSTLEDASQMAPQSRRLFDSTRARRAKLKKTRVYRVKQPRVVMRARSTDAAEQALESMKGSQSLTNMLNRIRKAGIARHRRIDLPSSKLRIELARLLKNNHYIHDYRIIKDDSPPILRLYLKYYNDMPRRLRNARWC